MQRFHGTAARQLMFIDAEVGESGTSPRLGFRPGSGQRGAFGVPRLRLMQKDMYAELTRRRRRAQIAARRWVDGPEDR
jgi:hypothetical protein